MNCLTAYVNRLDALDELMIALRLKDKPPNWGMTSMTVIPFRTDGPEPTVLTRSSEYRLNGRAILINDIDRS